MANTGSIIEETVDVYTQFPYELLEDDWVKDQWDNGFLNSTIELTSTIDHDQLDNLLKEAVNLCHSWIKRSECSDQNQSSDLNVTLWSTLLDNNIQWKKLLALICMLTQRSSSHGFNISDKITSLNASGLYFALLAIPGSKAFRIYHPNLFSLALTALRLPRAKILCRKRGVPKGKTNPSKKSKQDNSDSQSKGRRREKTNNLANEVFTPEESDDGSSDRQSDKLENDFDVEDVDYFVNVLTSVMKDFLYLMENFSLKDDKNSVEQIIQIMVEFVRLDTENSVILFDQRFEDTYHKKKNDYHAVAFYAYKILLTLCNQLHGDNMQNIIGIFKYIMPNILMSDAGGFQTIPHNIQIVKDHSTSFICYIIKNFKENAIKGARILLQQLSVQTIDKAEFRAKVSQAITVVLNCFPLEPYAQMVEWFFKLVRHAKVNYRVCALEIFSHLLSEQEKEIIDESLQSLKSVLSHKNIIYSILSKCNDKAPSVRAKALTIVASQAQKLVHILNSKKNLIQNDQNHNAGKEDPMDEQDDAFMQQEYDVKSVMEMLLKRVKDTKVNVRKTAIQVMEKLLCLDKSSVNEKYLQVIQEHCRDPAVLVRKQALHSLTIIFETYKDSDVTQQFWMKGVLCQLFDAEASIQEKCLDMIDCILFQNLTVTSNNVLQHEVAWKILNFIAYGKYQDFQRYLQKAIHLLVKKGKIKESMITHLKCHVGGSNDPAVWLLLASFALYLDFHDTHFILNYWEECKENKKTICTSTLQRIIKVIGYLANTFHKEKLEIIKDDLELQIKKFLCIPELIASSVETLCNIYIALYSQSTENQKKIKSFSKEVITDCDTYLSSVILEKLDDMNSYTEEQVIKRLFTLGELAQLSPNSIPSRLFLIIQSVVASGFNDDIDSNQNNQANTQPNTIVPSQYNGNKITSKVRAHAFIALGKLCLQNENFAKKSIAALAKELVSSSDPIIRNNIVIIMADLSVRYTLLVDPYISSVTACLKDSSPFVRKQTLILLTQLLQEDYIKWKGTLFFRMLITLIDENNEIQNFVRYSLGHLLLQRHPHMFFQHFVESIFFYNCYTSHSSYNKFTQRKEEAELFALNGSKNKCNRMILYKFMLENMNDEERFKLNLKLCQDILSAVPETIPLNQESAGLLQDALSILCCDEIKLTTLTSSVQDEVEDGDVAAAIVATAKKTIISHMVKKNVIENIVPIVIALKHVFEKVKSPLLKDLMLFLRELLKDYKNELKEIMAADKQLAKEIEFDLRRFEQEEVTNVQQEDKNKGEKSIKEKVPQKELGTVKTPQKNSGTQQDYPDKTPVNEVMNRRNSSASILNSVRIAKKLVEEVAKRKNATTVIPHQNEKSNILQKRFRSELCIKNPVISLERIDKKVLELSNLTPRICLQRNILCQTPKAFSKINTKPKTLFQVTSTPAGEKNKTLQMQNDISAICASPNTTAQDINCNDLSHIDFTL
ncbi:condensin-2 complex subunit D3-L-like [Centruroides vittatus]|uniref:condensin-2 complex subunit D3-L-like n=1 Tax=Centruroides vittatus TaxID=120091 RepID=UPI00350F9C7F